MAEEHSSINYAYEMCVIAKDVPIYTEADYEATMELLEDAHATLRSVFVGGQTPGVPDDWRIDGIVYRRWDMALEEAKAKLTQKFRASKFFSAVRRAERHDKEIKDSLDNTRWTPLRDYDEFIKFRQKGFDVREIRAGRVTKYEFTTRKEVAKGRNQI